jgi:hypothetical protein
MMRGVNVERPEPAPEGHKRLAQGFNPGLAPNPELKPWAILFCPCGANSDRWPRKQGHSTASRARRPRERGRSNCFPT